MKKDTRNFLFVLAAAGAAAFVLGRVSKGSKSPTLNLPGNNGNSQIFKTSTGNSIVSSGVTAQGVANPVPLISDI